MEVLNGTLTPDSSNQNRFPLDFLHSFTVILPSVTRNFDKSNLPIFVSPQIISI